MAIMLVLVPLAFGLGVVGLAAFLWALNTGQFEDMEGHASRILRPEDDDRP